MWKFIAICSIAVQLSAHAAQNHDVPLKCEKEAETDDHLVYFDCYFINAESSKIQVHVTSSNFDVTSLDSSMTVIRLGISGNVNYPEYFPKNLAKTVNGITDLFYKRTPLRCINRDDFKDMASKLKLLSLENNEIENISFDAFYDLINLDYLDVSDNNLKKLESNLFINSPNFGHLNVKSNKLTELHQNLFKNCPKFFILYAEFNEIEKLDEDLFKNNPNMTVISMRHNKVKNVPFDFSKYDEHLEVADFTHNSGTCDTMFFNFEPYVEYYNEEEQKKWIKTIPEFQQKIEDVCRQ